MFFLLACREEAFSKLATLINQFFPELRGKVLIVFCVVDGVEELVIRAIVLAKALSIKLMRLKKACRGHGKIELFRHRLKNLSFNFR